MLTFFTTAQCRSNAKYMSSFCHKILGRPSLPENCGLQDAHMNQSKENYSCSMLITFFFLFN